MPIDANPQETNTPASRVFLTEGNTIMATGKIQLINGNWYFFYGGRMMDLKCGPRTKPPVTQEQAENRCAEQIETFIRDTDEWAARSISISR